MHLTHIKDIKIRLFLLLAITALPLQGYCNRSYLDTLKTKIATFGATKADTSRTALADTSLHLHTDTLVTDTLSNVQDTAINRSTLEAPIFSGGRDSIVKDFNVDGRKMIYYYGDVKVSYNDMEITAEYMAFDVDSKTVFAKGLPDTTGKIIGAPVMKQGESQYEMESVYYNFNSGKAKIKNMITQEAEGYLHGKYIKKMPDNSINISKGKYTTCDLEHPHFYLQMTAAKVVQDPDGGQKTVFGPAYVVLEDVPTPFALPFGFVPQFKGRSSGLLMPSYGEEAARGFFMWGLG